MKVLHRSHFKRSPRQRCPWFTRVRSMRHRQTGTSAVEHIASLIGPRNRRLCTHLSLSNLKVQAWQWFMHASASIKSLNLHSRSRSITTASPFPLTTHDRATSITMIPSHLLSIQPVNSLPPSRCQSRNQLPSPGRPSKAQRLAGCLFSSCHSLPAVNDCHPIDSSPPANVRKRTKQHLYSFSSSFLLHLLCVSCSSCVLSSPNLLGGQMNRAVIQKGALY